MAMRLHGKRAALDAGGGLGARLAGLAAFVISITFAGAASAGVSFVCDPSIGAALCTTINSTVDPIYDNTFTNADASIYLTFGNTGLGSNEQYVNFVPYTDYVGALAAETHASSGVVRLDALSSLAANATTVYGAGYVGGTSALLTDIGFSGATGNTSTLAPCSIGTAGCYNAYMVLASPAILAGESSNDWSYYFRTGTEASNQFDIFSVIEHETDEVLGTISCISDSTSGLSNFCAGATGQPNTPSAADLYRYSAPGSLSLQTNNPAYFSYDGGVTDVANYNTANNGGDFGDFNLQYTCAQNYIQDAFACAGSSGDITSDGGPEVKLLDAVGFNLATAVPEPDAWAILLLGVALVGGTLRARRRHEGQVA
jgi:hypothetical protein